MVTLSLIASIRADSWGVTGTATSVLSVVTNRAPDGDARIISAHICFLAK
jgi:hypothetical protein